MTTVSVRKMLDDMEVNKITGSNVDMSNNVLMIEKAFQEIR